MLVPEIALTPQTVARFQARFGDTVALLHSALGEGERYDEWRRLRSGEARIAVGPRSAVFAPVADLGLVVVDEEHDASYKHEGDPRYDARRVAAERARRAGGAALLVGSATPRPETWRALPRLTLRERVDGRAAAARARARHARRAATRCTPRRGGRWATRASRSCCSTGAAGRTSSPAAPAGRSGSARTATSRSCCTAPQRAIACHHCGHRERVPQRCDACGSLAVARHGAGHRAHRAELREALDVPVFRLDADTAGAKDAVRELLARFDAAPAGLLLGTQMVAKGHDFPDVTLGVVLDADSTLRFPDFRAEERTFALIAQLAGRAGRGPRGGRVLVQTDRARRARDRRRRPPRRRGLPGRRARAPAGAALPAVRGPDPGRLPGRGRRARRARRPATWLARGARRAPARERARPGAAVPPARPRALPARGQDAARRAAAIAAVGAAVERAARDRAHRDVAFSVDVDPQ